jgi:hypothetical protein
VSGVHTLRSTRNGVDNYLTMCELVKEQNDNTTHAWTLVLRADGSKNTFLYDMPLWSDHSTFGSRTDIANTTAEVKLESFSSVSFEKLAFVAHGTVETRLGTNTTAAINSVKDLVAQPSFTPVTGNAIAEASINDFLPGDRVISNCLNVVTSFRRESGGNLLMGVRIGVVSDEETPLTGPVTERGKCPNPNTVLGVGGGGEGIFNKMIKPPAAGSYCNASGSCDPSVVVKALISVFVR